MRGTCAGRRGLTALVGIIGVAGCLALTGCGGTNNALEFMLGGTPYYGFIGNVEVVTGPGTTTTQTGSSLTTSTGFVDPCNEAQSRKFITISMRNTARDDYIHYFMVMIAYVNSETYPDGAVCPTDVPLYTSAGYSQIQEGTEVAFGNYCIQGPALLYFHDNGQFQTTGGTLGSAIAPAEGSQARYDNFFTSAGARMPVPNAILFHNPGTTAEGQSLLLSRHSPSPCEPGTINPGDPNCLQDAFYYVDENDRRTGSTGLGVGSGRRVPSDIQGTSCECGAIVPNGQQAFQLLAPSGTSAADAQCNEFFRGGRIDYAFLREDTEPPIPQLVWRVRDSGGALVHDFDPRANIN